MNYVITIHEKRDRVVVWQEDDFGVRTIVNILESASEVLYIPRTKSVVGRTGMQLRYRAYPDAVVVADYRFD